MKTFSINTLGCKVNQYESQQIRELLEQLGLRGAKSSDNQADLIVVNTCCVTHTASAKSRQYIRKAQKLNPNAAVIVSGCLPAVQNGELNDLGTNVEFVREPGSLAAVLRQTVNSTNASPSGKTTQADIETCIKPKNSFKIKDEKLSSQPELPQLTAFKGQTRAFLKVQDGCDGYCSYCIIPKARPFVRSRPAAEVLKEAQALVKAGHKEIVLTGIFLGAYGQNTVRRRKWQNEQNDKLANLLEKIAQIQGLERIRLSSLEPADVTERLLDTFCKHRNILPHLHLSLQSGSDAVLRKMCRQYTTQQFFSKVDLIKSRLDRPAITCDLIVGFPGETDADFQATADLAKEVGFSKMHIFSFSARQGTAAAKMQDSIDTTVIKQRSQILRDLDKRLGHEFRQRFIGETVEVLLEDGGKQPRGHSERYFMVYFDKAEVISKTGEIVKVRLIKNSENGVIGVVESKKDLVEEQAYVK